MQSKRYIARFSTPLYYMRTSSSRYKKCLKTKLIQSILTNRSTAATPTISTPESSIDFDVEKKFRVIKRKAENSESDKPKPKQTKLSSYFAEK